MRIIFVRKIQWLHQRTMTVPKNVLEGNSVFFQRYSAEFPRSDFRGGAPKSGLNSSDKNPEFRVRDHEKSCKIPQNFLGGCAPNPPLFYHCRFWTNYKLSNYLYQFGYGNETSNFFQSVRANVNDFAGLRYGTWSFLSKTIYWQVCVAVCQKPAAGADFLGVFFVENWNSAFSFIEKKTLILS